MTDGLHETIIDVVDLTIGWSEDAVLQRKASFQVERGDIFVILGGQSFALLLTLIVTPVAYSLFDDASALRLFSRLLAHQRGRRMEPAPVAVHAMTRVQ